MMVGRNILINILTGILLVLLLPLPAMARQTDHVAVLLSDKVEIYTSTLAAFGDEIGVDVKLYNLYGNIRHDPALKNRLLASQPRLIFALGAKAAFAAKLWTRNHPEIPVLFSMVYNWQKYNLLQGRNNIAGISSEIAPGAQFVNLSMFAPKAKRIGVIYSTAHSAIMIKKARKAAAILGLELVERQVASSNEFKRTYRRISGKIDALWLVNDPLTYTLDNMDWIQERCIKDKLVCIGQSERLTEAGLTISVLPDIINIGSQAASLARNIIEKGQSPKEIGVMEPLSTNVIVNQRTARRIGLRLSSQAMSMATEVIE